MTVRDFWRRWHISLTRWFTDYVYIPLGGSRRGTGRALRNTMVVFLLSGLWHGADVTFLIWGGLHGLYLCAELLMSGRNAPRHPRLRHGLTLVLVGFGWIFFRADSLAAALEIMRAILTNPAPGALWSGLGLSAPRAVLLAGTLPLLPMAEKLPPLQPDGKANPQYFALLLLVLFCWLVPLTQGGTAAFLYFQF